jgi:hypothetical protein
MSRQAKKKRKGAADPAAVASSGDQIRRDMQRPGIGAALESSSLRIREDAGGHRHRAPEVDRQGSGSVTVSSSALIGGARQKMHCRLLNNRDCKVSVDSVSRSMQFVAIVLLKYGLFGVTNGLVLRGASRPPQATYNGSA